LKQKSLSLNVAMNMARTVGGIVFPLITFPYTSRILGPEGSGKWNFATSVVGYFVLLASLGVPLYGIREVAKVRDDKERLGALVQELLALHAIAGAVSMVALSFLVAFNPALTQEAVLFLVVGFGIPFSVISVEWLYQGLEEYAYVALRSLGFSLLSVLGLFLFVHEKEDYVVGAAVGMVAVLGSAAMNFWNARKLIFAPRQREWSLRRHLKPMATVYVLNFFISIYTSLDVVILGFLSPARDVGYYSSALKLAKAFVALAISFGAVLLPRLSYCLANGQTKEFDRLLKQSLRIMLFFSMPITVALMLTNREMLLLLAGQMYLPASNCVIITAPVVMFIGFTNILSFQVLYPLGHERAVLLSVMAGAIASLSANFLLIPRYSHVGAAWGTMLAECGVLIAQMIMVQRVYVIKWPIINALKCLVGCSGIAVTVSCVHWLFPEEQYYLRLLTEVPLGVVVYAFVLHLLGEDFAGELLRRIKGKFGFPAAHITD
jgi:O-antigen/teichoic acid export membrane protein